MVDPSMHKHWGSYGHLHDVVRAKAVATGPDVVQPDWADTSSGKSSNTVRPKHSVVERLIVMCAWLCGV